MDSVVLYTDGACLGNPGPGGWAYALIVNGWKKSARSGGAPDTTNNRMELMAVINGLSDLDEPASLTVCSDSQYVIHAFTQNWVEGWRRNGWTRSGGELANKELWQTLYLLSRKHIVSWKWVKGHSGDQYNELCDQMASEAAQRFAENGHMAQGAEMDGSGQLSMQEGCDTLDQMSIDAVAGVSQPEDAEAIKKQLSDTLYVLNMSLVHANMRDYGIEAPCGACPWCEFCPAQMPQDGCHSCAQAYVAYHIAKAARAAGMAA